MPAYARVRLFINGVERNDLRNYEFMDQVYSKAIKLMNTTDYVDLVTEYSFSFTTIPKTPSNLVDWNSLLDGNATVNVKLKDGQTRIHRECRVISVKDSALDGETEMSHTVTCYCKSVALS